jgi:hypothetical protein
MPGAIRSSGESEPTARIGTIGVAGPWGGAANAGPVKAGPRPAPTPRSLQAPTPTGPIRSVRIVFFMLIRLTPKLFHTHYPLWFDKFVLIGVGVDLIEPAFGITKHHS